LLSYFANFLLFPFLPWLFYEQDLPGRSESGFHVFVLFVFFQSGSKGAEISPRLGTGSNPTSLCFLRIYDSTVLLHPQIFQHFSPASWAHLLFFSFCNQLFLKKRTHNIHFVVFSQHLPGVIAFFTKSKVFGRLARRSVGRLLHQGKSNNGFIFMFLCLGRNQLRSSAAFRRINVFSGYDVPCIVPYILQGMSLPYSAVFFSMHCFHLIHTGLLVYISMLPNPFSYLIRRSSAMLVLWFGMMLSCAVTSRRTEALYTIVYQCTSTNHNLQLGLEKMHLETGLLSQACAQKLDVSIIIISHIVGHLLSTSISSHQLFTCPAT